MYVKIDIYNFKDGYIILPKELYFDMKQWIQGCL